VSHRSAVVLCSGRGSNLEAILQAIKHDGLALKVDTVLTDNPEAGALSLAAAHKVPSQVLAYPGKAKRAQWQAELLAALRSYDPELVILAGFMRILGPEIIRHFSPRVLNIHPSLLPAFPGLHAVKQAIDAGVRVSGCTVHVVDEGVDTGPILAQVAVEVSPQDNVDSLHARIHKAEHTLYPQVLQAYCRGELRLSRQAESESSATQTP